MQKINRILISAVILALLIYTRFINLSWGLPYPMHPDERNMANAVQQLNCDISTHSINSGQDFKFQISNCYNPHFFAYGQFPLYLGYVLNQDYHFLARKLDQPITFVEAVLSLRIISAMASIINVFILIAIVKLILEDKNSKLRITNFGLISAFAISVFSPFFIQFSHFGTTESLLMLLYSLIVYKSLQLLKTKENFKKKDFLILALVSGIAVATKVSSIIFLVIPILAMIHKDKKLIFQVVYFLILTLLIGIIFSPHNFISFKEFLGSMKYETDVAFGNYRAFYTRQFEYTVPVVFQFIKIFPYALGVPVLILFLFGFFFLPFNKEINLLRLSFLIYFVPNAFVFTKWTRFMSPVFPMMIVLAVLFLEFFIFKPFNKLKTYPKIFLLIFFIAIITISVIPGIAYLSIYQNSDVRFTASDWIFKNIPYNAFILSETANVVDIPLTPPNYKLAVKDLQVVSFNLYDLDENQFLQDDLKNYISRADYIFVPSRRIFANQYCMNSDKLQMTNKQINLKFLMTNYKKRCEYLRKIYPLLNDYYDKLFSGQLGFKEVAQFSSYPKIQLFGKTLLEFSDEQAEETWTIFDHPVIRIYKKI